MDPRADPSPLCGEAPSIKIKEPPPKEEDI